MQCWAGGRINVEDHFPRLKAAFAERDDLAEDDIEASRMIIASATGGGIFR